MVVIHFWIAIVAYVLVLRSHGECTTCSLVPPQSEINSLLALYYNTTGDQWIISWNFSNSNPCAGWYGVTCCQIEAVCHVTKLRLSANNLVGRLPSAIDGFTALQTLELGGNKLNNKIPSSIGNLPALERLELQSNNLTGPIPSSIGNLQSLLYLELYDNPLTGSIPSSIGNLQSLLYLALYDNTLTGSIPSSIGNLQSLLFLQLCWIDLTGSIPSSIGNLQSLLYLQLYWIDLTGSIPSSIGNLQSLLSLQLYWTELSGSIPSSIENLRSLQSFELFDNALTGSIPSSIENLRSLRSILWNDNTLTGSIPSSIGNLRSLQYLVLNNNILTGPIPSSIGNLESLLYLELYDNTLTGPIPSSIGNVGSLWVLQLYNNALTNSIPSSIENLKALQTLELNYNLLTGSIPSTICGCSSLEYFDVSSNQLMFTIPEALPTSLMYFIVAHCFFTGFLSSVFDLSNLASLNAEGNLFSSIAIRQIPPPLQYMSVAGNRIPSSPAMDSLLNHPFVFLDLSSNRFNASLPGNVWNTSVQQLLLNNNRFSGTFPDRGDRVCSMQYVSVAGNGLSGSLPVDLQYCANLTNFFASDMQLTGSMSRRFATQPLLQVVVVSNNSLTGPIDDVFAASSASGLILNAAYNQFTGTLPLGSLLTGRYQSLILTSNCLSGKLPGDALCANGNLTELILSGLHSAALCRNEVFPMLAKVGVYSSYVETSAVGGTIPRCLFDDLSQLAYLALSGNALTGALPGEVRLSETLQGLDLSHNQLTGTIAAGIVAANLTLLDLSFNRLSGTISEQASDVYVRNPSAKVSLEVNELSGTLPRSWVEAVNISVLYGNLFACEAGRIGQTANRPRHDPLHATYACGSSTTNIALVVALVVGVSAVLVVLWVRWRGPLAAYSLCRSLVEEWGDVVRPWQIDEFVLVLYLVVSMVVYGVLTATTTVYSEAYVWNVSLALQNGVTAGCVLLVWLGFMVWASNRHIHSMVAKVSLQSVAVTRIATAMLLIGTAHVLPVFVVNMVYVYTTTLRMRGWVQAAVVLLMSVFKVAWNALVNVYMTTDARCMGYGPSSAGQDALFARQLLLWCGLINLIVSPVATEALVSPNCFRYLFSRIQTNSYSIAGGTCYWITYFSDGQQEQAIPCMSYSELEQTYNNNVTTFGMIIISTTTNGEASTVDYQAGFAYNYQCSFSLLQAFVYVFIYKYVLSMAVLPVVWWLLKRLQTRAYMRYGLSSVWYRWTTMCLPSMMKLLDSSEVDENDGGQATESNRARLVHWANVDQAKKCEMWLSLRMTGDLAVALSFGLLFPLLGLLALIGIGSDLLQTIWMVHRLRDHVDRVGRRAGLSMEAGNVRPGGPADVTGSSGEGMDQLQWKEYHRVAKEQLDALEKVVPSSMQSMTKDLLTVLCFAAVTWALTLYDIVGREEGGVKSLWILVVTLMMPWWMMGLWQAARYMWTVRGLPIIDEGDKGTVELTENPIHDVSSSAKVGSMDV